MENFAQRDFYVHWNELLFSLGFAKLVTTSSSSTTLLLHPLFEANIETLELFDWIEDLPFAETSIQLSFFKTTVMLTYFSLIAFDFALLNRSTYHFQFNRE